MLEYNSLKLYYQFNPFNLFRRNSCYSFSFLAFCNISLNAFLDLRIKINYVLVLFIRKLLIFKYYKLSFLLPLIILININEVRALLPAVTVKQISGSSPYITFNGGQTKETNLVSLLTIKLADGRAFIPENDITMIYPNAVVDTSSARSPIEVPVENNHFYDVFTFVPLSSGNGNTSSIELGTLLGSNYFWRDDDSDGDFSATGKVTLKWQDSSGADISSIAKEHPDWGFDPCQSPYRLTISVTNSDFSTRYGIPREVKNIVGSSHTYYLRPKITTPYVCYARPPDITNDSTTGSGLPDLNSSQWVPGQGFKPQDINYPPKNFPTTGANNFSFDIIIAGLTAQQVLEGYDNGSINGVYFEDNNPPKDGRENLDSKNDKDRATYTANYGSLAAKLSITPNQDISTGNKLRITLSGPHAPYLYAPTRGSTFYIDYRATNTRLYSFTIKKWFAVIHNNVSSCEAYITDSAHLALVPRTFMNYHEPAISDLTNANGLTWNSGIPGRNINNYRRQISSYSTYVFENHRGNWRPQEYWGINTINGGLFSEWGNITNVGQPDADWTQGNYLTNSEYEKTPRKDRKGKIVKDRWGNIVYDYKYYSVASYDGRILQDSATQLVCMFFGTAM